MAWLVLCSALAGCAGAAPPVSAAGAEPWSSVTTLDRSADVVVHVDRAAAHASPERFERTSDQDVYRIGGVLVDATATGLLLRGGSANSVPVAIDRRDVVRVFVVEQEPRWPHVLIGAAVGFGACALGGALGSSDDLFVFTEPEWAALCGAGGAGVGYFANRDPATLHLIYEKPARQAPVKR